MVTQGHAVLCADACLDSCMHLCVKTKSEECVCKCMCVCVCVVFVAIADIPQGADSGGDGGRTFFKHFKVASFHTAELRGVCASLRVSVCVFVLPV